MPSTEDGGANDLQSPAATTVSVILIQWDLPVNLGLATQQQFMLLAPRTSENLYFLAYRSEHYFTCVVPYSDAF